MGALFKLFVILLVDANWVVGGRCVRTEVVLRFDEKVEVIGEGEYVIVGIYVNRVFDEETGLDGLNSVHVAFEEVFDGDVLEELWICGSEYEDVTVGIEQGGLVLCA